MTRYQVTMKDRTVEEIADADAYQQEGPMTTFFAMGAGRQVVDCWSERVASFRTSEIIIIRRVEEPAARAPRSPAPASEPNPFVGAARDLDDELVIGRSAAVRREDVRTTGSVPFVVRGSATN